MQSVRSKLEATGIEDGADQAIILINPNSSDIFPLRKWPLDYFARLCGQILRCIDFTGKTSLRELLALYSIATVMVTNDSGPAHWKEIAL